MLHAHSHSLHWRSQKCVPRQIITKIPPFPIVSINLTTTFPCFKSQLLQCFSRNPKCPAKSDYIRKKQDNVGFGYSKHTHSIPPHNFPPDKLKLFTTLLLLTCTTIQLLLVFPTIKTLKIVSRNTF